MKQRFQKIKRKLGKRKSELLLTALFVTSMLIGALFIVVFIKQSASNYHLRQQIVSQHNPIKTS